MLLELNNITTKTDDMLHEIPLDTILIYTTCTTNVWVVRQGIVLFLC